MQVSAWLHSAGRFIGEPRVAHRRSCRSSPMPARNRQCFEQLGHVNCKEYIVTIAKQFASSHNRLPYRNVPSRTCTRTLEIDRWVQSHRNVWECMRALTMFTIPHPRTRDADSSAVRASTRLFSSASLARRAPELGAHRAGDLCQ